MSAVLKDIQQTAIAGGVRLEARGLHKRYGEREVLRRISLGASNKVVAQKLAISPSTVRPHVENAFRKLECSTRAAATLKATQLGLL